MAFEVKGKVVSVLPLQTGTSSSGKEWSKVTVIVDVPDGQYTKKIAFDNLNSADDFSKVEVGREYEFTFDVQSREWNGKWFTNVSCFKWHATDAQQEAATQGSAAQPEQQKKDDDLPF